MISTARVFLVGAVMGLATVGCKGDSKAKPEAQKPGPIQQLTPDKSRRVAPRPRVRPGGSAGERPLFAGLDKRAKQFEGTWVVSTGRWPPISEIWEVRGGQITRIDRSGGKTRGKLLVQSPCRVIVAGQPLQVRFDAKGFRVSDRPLLARHGKELLACVSGGTVWHRNGSCTLYPGEVVKGRGRGIACRVRTRRKMIGLELTLPAPAGKKQKARQVRVEGTAATLFPAAHYRWRTISAKSLGDANKRATASLQNYVLPFGLWFGQTKKQVKAHFQGGFYGKRTCRVYGEPEDLGPPWDRLPLPYLDLRVDGCTPTFDKAGGLAKLELGLSTEWNRTDGLSSLAAAQSAFQGLLRVPPKRTHKKRRRQVTWKKGGVQVQLDYVEDLTGDAPGVDRFLLSLKLTRLSGYRPPLPKERWKHPARRKTAFAWNRGKPVVFRPYGVKLGQSVAEVRRLLAGSKRKFKKVANAMGLVNRFLQETPIGDADAYQQYRCDLTVLGDSGGICLFRGGRLAHVLVVFYEGSSDHLQRLLARQLHHDGITRFGKQPLAKAGLWHRGHSMIWKIRDGLVVARLMSFSRGPTSDYALAVYITPSM